MPAYSNILIAYDGSPESRGALRAARALGRPDARLTVLTVNPSRPAAFHGEIDAEEARASALRILAGHPAAQMVSIEDDRPADAIRREAERRHADLIAIGGSAHHAFARVVLGSTTEGVLHQAPCAVLIARSELRRHVGRVGVCFDGSPHAYDAVMTAADLAGHHSAALSVLAVVDTRHVTPEFGPVGGYGEARIVARESLTDAVASIRGIGHVRRLVHEGDPATEAVRLSESLDLLVLGSRQNGPVGRLLLGSTSLKVARQAHCPVLVLPHEPLRPTSRPPSDRRALA